MVKITKKTDYGLTLLSVLASKPDELHSLRSIADSHQLPYKFIGQVASVLLEAGIIISKEGASGGYRLAKKPQDISLLQVMEALDGPPVHIDCLRGIACARSGECTHRHIMCSLRDIVNQSLQQKSLADLVSNK